MNTTSTNAILTSRPSKRHRNFKRVASVACVMSTTVTCLAPTPVSAFQGQLSFSTMVPKTANQAHLLKVRSLRPTPTELCYRDDPDYKSSETHPVNNHLSEEMKEQLNHDGGASSQTSQTTAPNQASASTSTSQLVPPPLSPKNQLSNVFHTWWTAAKTRRAHESAQEDALERSEQYDLDKYLESVDKRYKRLHQREHRSSRARAQQKKQQQQKNKSSGEGYTNALSWLLATEESSSEALEQRRQEDGIYVLGLAGLASDRLLQKHQLPKPKRSPTKASKRREANYYGSRVIDISSQKVIPPSSPTTTPFSTTSMSSPTKSSVRQSVLQLLYSIKHIQTALGSCMNLASVHTNNCFQESLYYTGKVMTNIPSLINNAIGGKWAKSAMMALVSAIFVMASNFRPFSRA